MTFGNWLRQRRTEQGITQEELSERLGFSAVMLRKLESGERRPSGQIASLLADYFRIPSDEREAFVAFARTGQISHAVGEETSGQGAEHTRTPWRRAYVHQTNLPTVLTPLIGREGERAAAREQILHPKTRLLTLTGAPGIGKTRLGLHVAAQVVEHFQDGVFFVDLSPIDDADLVLLAVARTLGLKEVAEQPVEEVLLDYMRERRMLLVLDNFEQVLDAAPQVVRLLEACPWLKVLVTSREALHVRGERRFSLPPLGLPNLRELPRVEELALYPSVELFVERAQAVAPEFALLEANAAEVAAVCVGLEGLPLAIELAAARVRHLSPQELRGALHSRLKLLTGGGRDLPLRHRTLYAAIDWSYNLLGESEQRLFRQLGVFLGGFSLDAAQAVSADQIPVINILLTLVDKNLVKQERLSNGVGAVGGSTFGMLEAIREYALEQLRQAGEGEAEETQRRHANFFMGLAEQAQPELKGPHQAMWLERLDVEFDNIRAALEWASDSDPEVAVRMMFALTRFWHIRGHYAEGSNWIERVLARRAGVSPIVRAKALRVAGQLAHFQNNVQQALSYLEESLIWARQAGDKALTSDVLSQLGYGLLEQGNHERAKTMFEESLVLDRERGDTSGISWLTTALGELARLDEDYVQARAYYEEGLLLAREAGNAYNICILVANLGSVALAEGDYERAVPLFEESMTLVRELGYEAGMVGCLAGFVGTAVAQGQPERAAKLSGAMEHLFQTINAGLDSTDQRAYERYVASARASLEEEEFERARAAGCAMTMEEAIEYALKDDA